MSEHGTNLAGVCGNCGARLSAHGTGQLCPACLVRAALTDDDGASTPPIECLDYTLIEEVGRGRSGSVWRAHHDEGGETVAIKVLIGGPLCSADERRRFLREAEITRGLEHPGIVRVRELREADGHLLLVMDFVAGQSLARRLRDDPIPPRQAAAWLRDLACALDYAHQRGIVHRDLKPGNILINTQGWPLVVDFGFATVINPSGEESVSQSGLGTVSYLAPEQASGRAKSIGPATDIHGLGAVLYHCLTGRPPFVGENIPAILRAVTDQDVPSPRSFAPSIPRDLETICLKCLEKEPRKRFSTMRELADELNRFLNREPIHAKPVRFAGRIWRWCRRNAALAIAIGAAGLLLTGGIAISTSQAVRATRAEREQVALRRQAEAAETTARSEAKKSRNVADYLKELLAGVDPSTARGRDTTLMREIMDRGSERLGRSFRDQPEVESDLRTVLGNVYESLGEYSKAEAMHRRAFEIAGTHFGKESVNVANYLGNLAIAFERQGKFTEAESAFREALDRDRKRFGPEHRKIAKDLTNLGNIYWRQHKLADAEKLQREALTMGRKLLGDQHLEVARMRSNLAITLATLRKPAEAEPLFRDALAVQRAQLGADHPLVAQTMSNLGNSLTDQRKWSEAEPLYQEALALRRKLLGPDHPDLATALNNFAELAAKQGQLREAEAMHREALTIRRKKLGDGHAFTLLSLTNLANVLERQGKFDEVEELRREARSIEQKVEKKEGVMTGGSMKWIPSY